MRLDEQIASALRLPAQFIQGLAHKASHAYKTYDIPKKSGGTRTIHHPSRELKALQRWLLNNVVESWRVHDAAYAYRRGRNVHKHALVHANSSFLLRLDLQDFFPSITDADVLEYVQRRPSGTSAWDADDQKLFVNLVARYGRLTIGAPTSPALSNALCWELDVQLARLAEQSGSQYTRYADDLFFSTSQRDILRDIPGHVDRILGSLTCPAKLKRNVDKTHHSSRRRSRRVTGIVLSSDGRAVVGRHQKRRVRAMVHRVQSLSPEEQRRLRGLIAYVRSMDPDFVNALVLKYGTAHVAGLV